MTERTFSEATHSAGKPAISQLATVAEYAKLRGCSRQAVEKAAAAGRITLIDAALDELRHAMALAAAKSLAGAH